MTEGVAERLELREDVEVGNSDVLNHQWISLYQGIFSIVTTLEHLKQTWMVFNKLLQKLLLLLFLKTKDTRQIWQQLMSVILIELHVAVRQEIEHYKEKLVQDDLY